MLRYAIVIAGLVQSTAVMAGSIDYAYDARGRLVATEDTKSSTVTTTTIYWLDSADNRSRIQSISSDALTAPSFRFRRSNGRHFYSNSFGAGNDRGYEPEGSLFKLYKSSGSNMSPVYSCFWEPGDYYWIAPAGECDITGNIELLGYVSTTQSAYNRPLYRFFKSGTGDHLITPDYNEGANSGYTLEMQLGYVPL